MYAFDLTLGFKDEIDIADHTKPILYMGDSTHTQQKYAGAGKNCNIVITVIFYHINHAYYLGLKIVVCTQIHYLSAYKPKYYA